MSSTSGRDTAGGGQETGNRKRETEPARKRGGRGEQRATGNGTKVRWVNSGRLGWPIECDQRAGRFATFIVPCQRQFNEFPIHDQRLAVVTASTTRQRAFPTEQRSWTMLISDLVPLAMDGLSVALALQCLLALEQWGLGFEIRGSRSKKDSRFEIRGQRRNDRRDPGANHEKNAPIIYPGVYHPTVANLLPRFCPLSPLSSCGNRARAEPISYRQSLLQISKRSDCCIRHRSIRSNVSANPGTVLFSATRD